MKTALKLVEKGLVPKPLLRRGIRRLLRQRLAELRVTFGDGPYEDGGPGWAKLEAGLDAWIEHMRRAPVALVPEKANEQHYEVPARLYELCLGEHLKYSSGYYPTPETTLDEAEAAMLALTCERARLEDGQEVLELGCGAGQALLCLGARVPGLELSGVEVQAAYADLARRNGQENGQALEVIEADLEHLPEELRQQQFDQILANPPYFRVGAHVPSSDAGRKLAMGGATPLEQWIRVAAKRLQHKGYLHMIQRADRLPEMLAASADCLGSLEVLPLAARSGRQAELVLLRARKGGRAGFRLHAPLVLHAGDSHGRDAEDYRPEVRAILRAGAGLDWPQPR